MRWIAWLAAVGCTGAMEEYDTTTPPGTQPAPPVDTLPPDGPPVVEAYLGGSFATLPAFSGLASVYGAVQMVRNLDGTASLTVSATGLAPGVEHSAHVHTWPCAYEAGGHYLVDPATPDAGEANELWMTLTPDPDGNATYTKSIATGVRGDALAVVIHDPASGDKLACADLLPEQTVGAGAEGGIYPFAYYEPIDESIGGNARVTMGSSTTVELSVNGLTPTETYAAHVHVLPCDVTNAGGHYKLDPSVTDTLVDNEIWPTITVGPDGSATATLTVSGHTLREDGAAVVLHRTSAPDAPKVACADLGRTGYLQRTTYGTFTLLGTGAGSTVGGSATIDRRMDGVTVVEVELRGLTPDSEYPVHVHELPCQVLDGGGHYLIDPSLPDGDEANEIWANVVGGPNGTGTRAVGVSHLARAEAQSVVVHSADGTRLACADLK